MMTEFKDYVSFVEEAKKRGLQVLTHPPLKERPQEGEMFEPTFVGVRQHNPVPEGPDDQYIDMTYGVCQVICVNENEWETEALLFDTDDEYAAWEQEQMRKMYEGPGFPSAPE